jgi:hypothetical protein
MRARFLQETFLSVSLALTTVGPLFAADSSSAISAQSLERFLGSVPDYAGGTPSSNIIYSTRAVGEAANAPGRTVSHGPSVLMIGTPAARQPLSSSTLSGGTIERRTNTPHMVEPGILERRSVQPYEVTSPWR